MRYDQERKNATLETKATAVGLECTLTSTLDPAIYNEPLTLVIKAPGASNIKAIRDGKPLPAHVRDDTILIEAAPARTTIAVEWITAPAKSQ